MFIILLKYSVVLLLYVYLPGATAQDGGQSGGNVPLASLPGDGNGEFQGGGTGAGGIDVPKVELWQQVDKFSEDIAVPAGYEENPEVGKYVNTYVMEGDLGGGNTIYGKYTKETDRCEGEANGALAMMEKSKCKVLTFPPGTMNWIYASSDKQPSKNRMIKAGRQGFICRAVTPEGDLVTGVMGNEDKKCKVGFLEKKTEHARFEVLYINMMGHQLLRRAGIDALIGAMG